MTTPPDPTGTKGSPWLKAMGWWLIAAGILLMLPRQWPSAGIALGLGALFHLIHARRNRGNDGEHGTVSSKGEVDGSTRTT